VGYRERGNLSNFPHFFMARIFDFTWRSDMTVHDLLENFVFELLRRGFTLPQIVEALAEQKVKLMDFDRYRQAMKDFEQQP
jgi:hypothetical protein